VAATTFANPNTNIQPTSLAVGAQNLIVGTDIGVYTLPLSDVPASAAANFSGLSTTRATTLLVTGGTVYVGGVDNNNALSYVYSASEASAATSAAAWVTFGSGSTGSNSITSLAWSGGGLLAATNGGLISYATPTSIWISGNSSTNPSQQISDALNWVTSLYTDGVSVYAATSSNGIFVSPVGQTFSWTPFNGTGATALPALNVRSIRGAGTLLYAGTGGGVAIATALAGGGATTPPSTPPATSSSGSSGGGAFDPLSGLLLLGGMLGLLALRRPRR